LDVEDLPGVEFVIIPAAFEENVVTLAVKSGASGCGRNFCSMSLTVRSSSPCPKCKGFFPIEDPKAIDNHPPHVIQQDLLMSAEESGEYF
jgi:hypothetical protein